MEEERGSKPVTVQFEKYTVRLVAGGCQDDQVRQDKTSILHKAKLLKGTNILVSHLAQR